MSKDEKTNGHVDLEAIFTELRRCNRGGIVEATPARIRELARQVPIDAAVPADVQWFAQYLSGSYGPGWREPDPPPRPRPPLAAAADVALAAGLALLRQAAIARSQATDALHGATGLGILVLDGEAGNYWSTAAWGSEDRMPERVTTAEERAELHAAAEAAVRKWLSARAEVERLLTAQFVAYRRCGLVPAELYTEAGLFGTSR